MIRKEAGPFYRTSSSVCLWWEFKEPKGPKNRHWTSSSTSIGTTRRKYTHGTVHFVLKGDRGDKVSFTLKDQCYDPRCDKNVIAATDLHAYGLATVISPDKAQSGLWYEPNTPKARKFATFIEHNGHPFLLPCAMGVSEMAEVLACRT